ncbi:hypothetical protein JB92DRAFT_3118351 [Gautieria morchelliformis]|nr:hypothetical protein JB92DRAFT_3118351 [Gautieria morchelliformis]
MPKWSPFSVAKLFATPRTPLQTKWPRNSPASAKHFLTRNSKRSHLRFTPLAAGKIEPWIFRLLITLQDLLVDGKNEDALALCHDELSFASLHRNGHHDCYHRAITLFTRHGDFEAATSLCNRMAEEGLIVNTRTMMVLLRSMRTHDLEHVQQIQAMLRSGAAQLDDLAFKTILDTMELHNSSPEALENALDSYLAIRGTDWTAPISVYGTIIKAHSLAGQWDRAQEWLERYRQTRPLRDQTAASPITGSDLATADHSDALAGRLGLKLRRRNKSRPLMEHPSFPYAAILMGFVRSPAPPPQGVEWLFERMRSEGIDLDISMCNMLISAFFRWGWTHRAYAIYQSLLTPESLALPDAYTFRQIFNMLNPRRQRDVCEVAVPDATTARQLFKETIALDRLRLHPKKSQPHKNVISPATFNSALRTFIARDDYAAAWTVLSCFTRHHVCPDRDTMRIVILGLLRRMYKELTQKNTMDTIIWLDRFLGERRSTMIQVPNKKMLADRLYVVGRDAATELEASRCETYLKPSLEIQGATEHAMSFLVAILRVSLQASLGFPHPTQHKLAADKAIKMAMLQARSDMIPRGRLQRN